MAIHEKFGWNCYSSFQGDMSKNVTSCNLETKIIGHPLNITLDYFYVLHQYSTCAKFVISAFANS